MAVERFLGQNVKTDVIAVALRLYCPLREHHIRFRMFVNVASVFL